MPAGLIRLVLLGALALGLPAAAGATTGAGLYSENCLRCHGVGGSGVSGQGPSLRRVGARAADFYLRTGYMPLRDPEQQPWRRHPRFSDAQIAALVGYVASFGHGPPVPAVHPEHGSVSQGLRVFTEHCAGCHQVVAEGGYVVGARVPPLDRSTPTQIAEAVRIGPFLMPRFPESQISRRDLDSLAAYVEYAKNPDDRGGWALGHVGPVPEGLVSWLLAGAALVAVCALIGRRGTE